MGETGGVRPSSPHSIRVTVDTYGHLVPGGNNATVDGLDDVRAATTRNPDCLYGKRGGLIDAPGRLVAGAGRDDGQIPALSVVLPICLETCTSATRCVSMTAKRVSTRMPPT
jgi:hypothetical protein